MNKRENERAIRDWKRYVWNRTVYICIYIYIYICKSSRTEAFDIALLSDYVIVFVRSPPPYGRRVGKSVTVKKILSRFQDWPGSRLEKRGEARRGETKKKDKKERCPVDNHHGYLLCSQRTLENGFDTKIYFRYSRYYFHDRFILNGESLKLNLRSK